MSLASELIGDTIRRAYESPFYADLYRKAGLDETCVADLSTLHRYPIVDKEMLRDAGQSATCVQHLGDLSHLQHSSGTTAEPFLVHRSMAEASFIRSFFARLNYGDAPSDPGPIPIMLQSQLADHGLPTWIPARVLVLPFSVAEEYLIDHAFSFLDREFHLPNTDSRVSIISGNQSAILALTNCALEKGIDCSSRYAVRLLHVQGRYLTRRWRGVLESTWGATVSDKYSMAEVFGGANYCTACKSFHFEPIVVPEIVGCATRQPLTTGTGALLLSSLFPFVQLQPMIRYLTGDLFRIIPAGCNKPSFQFRGRMAHALFDYDNPDQVLLTGPDIVEAVDHIPEINRGSRFNDLMSVRYKQAAGEVRVKGVVSRSPARTTIDLVTELTFPPALFAERAAEIRSEVRQNLLVQSEYLADAVSNDRIALSVSLVGPGALAPMMKFAGLWVHQ